MSEVCKDCLPGILNNQKSIISSPICVDDCTTEVNCAGNVTFTPCVVSNVSLPCVALPVNSTQTAINLAFDTKLCQIKTAQCTSAVSGDDTCCGYLDSKILGGDGITVTVTNPGACEKLTISETCWAFNLVTAQGTSLTGSFLNGWVNSSAFLPTAQVAQYSNVKECSVRLRGLIFNNLKPCLSSTIFVLPIGKRPLSLRTFSVILTNVVNFSGCQKYTMGIVTIFPNGNVTISYGDATGGWSFSLDGIFFEIN